MGSVTPVAEVLVNTGGDESQPVPLQTYALPLLSTAMQKLIETQETDLIV
jgi:hypothetical protein